MFLSQKSTEFNLGKFVDFVKSGQKKTFFLTAFHFKKYKKINEKSQKINFYSIF